MLELVGLTEFAERSVVSLSGGQMQRTAAARMFVRAPELFVFDDLSSALDVETEQTLWTRMFERRGTEAGQTCLVVSHRRPALRHADQIIVLKDGSVHATGTLHDLRRSCITHWARKIAAPVVQALAGHSDIHTTLRYYVSIREPDMAEARDVTAQVLPADPQWTQSRPKPVRSSTNAYSTNTDHTCVDSDIVI